MTNEQYIMSKISELSLADMFTTGNVYYDTLNSRLYKAFCYWKASYRYKRSNKLLFQLWLTFQYNPIEWEKARSAIMFQDYYDRWK